MQDGISSFVLSDLTVAINLCTLKTLTLGIAAASALSLGQTIQSIFADEIMTNGDSNIARSWECIK